MKRLCSIILTLSFLFLTSSLLGCSSEPILLNVNQEFTINDTLEHANDKNAKVILLFGQSNATGCSSKTYYESSYPDQFEIICDTISKVNIIFITENGGNSSQNSFVPCSFDCGCAAGYFGPEVGIAYQYEKAYPDDEIFIIKYSYGGTTLDNQWLNGSHERGELYSAAMSFSLSALSYLSEIGYKIDLQGICWMQGENDSCNIKYARNYQNNTIKLIDYLRCDLAEYSENIPFIDAKIADITAWPFHDKINNAKTQNAAEMNYVFILDTVDMGLTTNKEPYDTPDIAHYDSESMLHLGIGFGDELLRQNED